MNARSHPKDGRLVPCPGDASEGGSPVWAAKPDYRSDLFAGAAEHYAKYRVPYPEALFTDLLERSGARANGLLVDLACGTGQIAIPLASRFRRVLAMDQEPEMLAVGQREALASRIGNIEWRIGRVEDAEIGSGSCELVCIGNAFHRLDRVVVAEKCRQWLRSGACLAIVGSSSIYSGTEPWQVAAAKIIRKWIDPADGNDGRFDAAAIVKQDRHRLSHEDLLKRMTFADVTEYCFPTDHRWTLSDLTGYVGSLSGASPKLLGEKFELLKRELSEILGEYAKESSFGETIKFYYILCRNV